LKFTNCLDARDEREFHGETVAGNSFETLHD